DDLSQHWNHISHPANHAGKGGRDRDLKARSGGLRRVPKRIHGANGPEDEPDDTILTRESVEHPVAIERLSQPPFEHFGRAGNREAAVPGLARESPSEVDYVLRREPVQIIRYCHNVASLAKCRQLVNTFRDLAIRGSRNRESGRRRN